MASQLRQVVEPLFREQNDRLTQHFEELKRMINEMKISTGASATKGGRKTGVKKEKDVNAPTKPQTTWILFCNDPEVKNDPRFQVKDENLTPKEKRQQHVNLLKEHWNNTPGVKDKYIETHKKMMDQYIINLEKYKASKNAATENREEESCIDGENDSIVDDATIEEVMNSRKKGPAKKTGGAKVKSTAQVVSVVNSDTE